MIIGAWHSGTAADSGSAFGWFDSSSAYREDVLKKTAYHLPQKRMSGLRAAVLTVRFGEMAESGRRQLHAKQPRGNSPEVRILLSPLSAGLALPVFRFLALARVCPGSRLRLILPVFKYWVSRPLRPL